MGGKDDGQLLSEMVGTADDHLKREEAYANAEADWDKTEDHRLANMAYKVTDIDVQSPDTKKCLCCQQPIPTEEHYFSMFDTDLEFMKLGAAGFPLLFEFNKRLCGIMFTLTLIYGIPMIALWAQAHEPLSENTDLL
jgi:hypothetical protein